MPEDQKDGTQDQPVTEKEPKEVPAGDPAGAGDGSGDQSEIAQLRARVFELERERNARREEPVRESPPTREDQALKDDMRKLERDLREAQRLADTDPAAAASVRALEIALEARRDAARFRDETRAEIFLSGLSEEDAYWTRQYFYGKDGKGGDYRTMQAAYKGYRHDYVEWEKKQKATAKTSKTEEPVRTVSTAARPEARRSEDGKFETDAEKLLASVKTYGDFNREMKKAEKSGNSTLANELYKKYASGGLVTDED